MLKSSGKFEAVVGFGSTETLIEQSEHAVQSPDMAILDLGLPGKSGIECMLYLKTYFPLIKVLIFSVYDSNDKVFDALQSGADGYLLKQESLARILESIDDAFAGGAPMSRAIARRVLLHMRKKEVEYTQPEISFFQLSSKELEVLEALSTGKLYKEIAQDLDTSIDMIKQYAHQIYRKMQVQNRTEATLKYLGKN